jgi:hypothetical protein
MNADGSDARPLVKDARWESTPPGRPRVIASRSRPRAGWAWLEPSEIWTVRPDGSELRGVVEEAVAIEPSWSLDGRRLAYTDDAAGRGSAADGGRADAAPRSTKAGAWRPA